MLKLLLIAALNALGMCRCQPQPHNLTTFMNPIVNEGGDPWIFRHGHHYYLTWTNNANIILHRSRSLTDWSKSDTRPLLLPPPMQNYSTEIWAPEIHQIHDKWYAIFTAQPGPASSTFEMRCQYSCPSINHRMFVAEGIGSSPWDAEWEFKAELESYDTFAIDGTYFRYKGKLYYVYSCWNEKYDGWPANICIAKMKNPWTISSSYTERQVISVPEYAWEKTPYGRSINDRLATNEGPQQLVNPATGQQFIIFSAGRSDNRNYCLAQLELVGDDPMDPGAWHKHSHPVFRQNPSESTYGVGHASFTTSPDGKEHWMVYHGIGTDTGGWPDRTIRAQKFTWSKNGSPQFPQPGLGPYQMPSGQKPISHFQANLTSSIVQAELCDYS